MPVVDDKDDSRSDEELIDQFLEGDQAAYSVLVCRYEKTLYSFIYRYTGNSEMSEDVFQETFLQIHKSAGSFDTSRLFRSWLFTIALNKARDMMRRKSRKHVSLDTRIDSEGKSSSIADYLPSKKLGPEQIFMNQETIDNVNVIVEQMSPTHRAVLSLSYYQKLPHKEVAEILGIPVGTVKSRLHAAIKDFSKRWTDANGDMSND